MTDETQRINGCQIVIPEDDLKAALEKTRWNLTATGKIFGVGRETIRRKIRKHGLKRPVQKVEIADIEEDHRLRQENSELRKQLEQLVQERAADSAALKILTDSGNRGLSPPKWLAPAKKGRIERATVMALLSDCHFDEVVRPEEFNYTNAYNRQIAKMRLRNFFTNLIRLSYEYINGIRVDGLVLAMLGDMLSGNIHEELRRTNEAPILDSLLYWSSEIAAGIGLLLDRFPKIYVPCIVGNHGRLDRKPTYKHRVQDNYDWLLYHMIAQHFSNEKDIEFAIPQSTDIGFHVYKWRYHLTHGDQFKGGSGISGILLPVMLGGHRKSKRELAIGTPYDVLCLGHFHQQRDFGSTIINGALKGYDEYAYAKNLEFEEPKQYFWLVDPQYGKTISAPIHVMDENESWRKSVT